METTAWQDKINITSRFFFIYFYVDQKNWSKLVNKN